MTSYPSPAAGRPWESCRLSRSTPAAATPVTAAGWAPEGSALLDLCWRITCWRWGLPGGGVQEEACLVPTLSLTQRNDRSTSCSLAFCPVLVCSRRHVPVMVWCRSFCSSFAAGADVVLLCWGLDARLHADGAGCWKPAVQQYPTSGCPQLLWGAWMRQSLFPGCIGCIRAHMLCDNSILLKASFPGVELQSSLPMNNAAAGVPCRNSNLSNQSATSLMQESSAS